MIGRDFKDTGSSVKVSIIIPAYNVGDYIDECLDSIVEQTLRNIEIIVVDDGSADKTLELLNKQSKQDQRVKVVCNKANLGPAESRNKAIMMARGEYICFADGDDKYDNDGVLEKMYKTAQKYRADIVVGSIVVDDVASNSVIDNWPKGSRQYNNIMRRNGPINYSKWQMDYSFQRCMFRRSLILNNGIAFPNLRRFEDPVFMVRAMISAQAIYGIKDVVYRYRYGHKSGDDTFSDIQLEDQIKGCAMNMEVARQHGYNVLYNNSLHDVLWAMENSAKYVNLNNANHALTDEVARLKVDYKEIADSYEGLKSDYNSIKSTSVKYILRAIVRRLKKK